MPKAPTNGINTYYEEEGSGPAVVLIHGHSANRHLWDGQFAFLPRNGFRAVRYDARGHGRSDAPQSGYTFENYALDLRDLLDHLRIERAHLVGLSMGGGIALTFALDNPRRAASLALISSCLPGYAYSPEYEEDIERLRDAVRREGPAAFEKHWLEHPMFAPIRRSPERFDSLRRIVTGYSAADYLDETEYPLPERRPSDRLHEIAAPTLVMAGALDLPDFLLIAEILAANIPGAHRLIVPDAGDVLSLEAPDALNEALLSFLRNAGTR
ncbi:MAG: alpha/beta fold hydrolase [Dehalococcoidia bacterium]|nr:alpha/beta fold hydrolase [Dehalococcoidia bacterium]